MVGDLYEVDVVGAHGVGIKGVLVDIRGSQLSRYAEATAAVHGIGEIPEALEGML